MEFTGESDLEALMEDTDVMEVDQEGMESDVETDEESLESLDETEQFLAARWESNYEGTFPHERPDVLAWMVRCDKERSTIGARREVWIKGGASNPEAGELFNSLKMRPDDHVRNCGSGFVRGQALSRERTAMIRVCNRKDLNRFAFRVTHDGMPHDGLTARGYGLVKTDPLHFQNLVQLHLNWNWRGKSPFVSVVSSLDLALLFCEKYINKGCQGVKIHVINMTGRGWAHSGQRIFHASHLAKQFGLKMREPFKFEYLVESKIPEACVVETVDCWQKASRLWRYSGVHSTIMERIKWWSETLRIHRRIKYAMPRVPKMSEAKVRDWTSLSRTNGGKRSSGYHRVNYKDY